MAVRQRKTRAATAERGLLADLADAVPEDALVTDADLLESYRRDEAGWVPAGQPAAAVLPRSTEQVQEVVRTAARHRAPIVPRGAGSGLSGGATATDGCVVVSLERMDEILEVEPADQTILVEPGVLNEAVSDAVADEGLWYPPDPASKEFSTIGGNVATNAGGLCCVKYGVTLDHVLGLEVVLADGTLVRTGRRTVKGVAGLNLTGLFVGSEGTLGIVTAVRLRLRRRPPPAATAVAFFPSLASAGQAVAAVTRSAVVPSLLELLDRTTVRAVDDWRRMGLDREAAALLLAQSDAPDEARTREMEVLTDCFESAGASYVAATEDPDEGEQLLAARRVAYSALERLGDPLLDDVAVPRSRIPEFLGNVERIAERHDVLIGTFGHAGDGNMHPTLVADRQDDRSRAAAREAFDDLVTCAVDLGGSITGEHGVGQLKRRFLEQELGGPAVALQRRIKDTLDPQGLMNPGKAV